ncbi:16S rRNA (guanine(527)-N(7))-methyltransferase RsmG [uncultured Sphingomonas sp.]|uniref:16S rRNA (guanine(527)-N(7))-methyltransferase RsmG n=1 Tax=uncultured Sphingomonas sp. TaxID=158754 RepID=UPI0025E92ED1|nr:16S rRNA (guanine(527)-N(7))-methyltransferase RsmG [uncultured Sphingomonas sp.]
MISDLAEAAGRDVPRETFERVKAFAGLLRTENERQNLVGHSTLATLWDRHLIDSAQLLRHAPGRVNRWVDVGSGAGLPGIVLAILSGDPIALVEPRRLRADFLCRCVDQLHLSNAEVVCRKVEQVAGSFEVITARAVAPVDRLLAMTLHLSHPGTRWVLPKGRSGAKELADARRAWQGRFRAEVSITDPEAVVLVAEGVKPRDGTSR